MDKSINIDGANKVTIVEPGDDNLGITIVSESGFVKGNFKNSFDGSVKLQLTPFRGVIFDDATEKGRCLRVLPLLQNPMGVRASVYGDEFYFEVGRDKLRPDALYITRIERMRRNIHVLVHHYEAGQ